MKRATIAAMIGVWLAAVASVHADQTTASVQQVLKDQGFYYGEITGTKDADTTAAIRRYQIRNGLKITGELNPETQKSLGIHGAAPAPSGTPAPQPRTTPSPAPRATPSPSAPLQREPSDLRDGDRAPAPGFAGKPATVPGYAPGPRGSYPATSGVFDATPFEVAPPDVQRRVVLGAQSLLARQGLFRGALDGAYGPATEAAVRAYQSRFSLPTTGRLDMETLAALGLLPGQRAPGVAPARRPMYRPSPVVPYPGERVYVPR